MKIYTNEFPMVFMTLLPVKAADMKKKTRTGDDNTTTTVLTPDDRPVYITGLKALALDGDGLPSFEDKGVSISVVSPVDLKPGIQYKAAGKMWITPYITGNKRQGYSVMAEKLVPVEQVAGDDK